MVDIWMAYGGSLGSTLVLWLRGIIYMKSKTPKSWNMGLGRFMAVFLLCFALGSQGGHIPTFWLLL